MAAEAKEAYIEQYSPPSTADNEPVEVVDAADAVERFLNGEVDQAIAAKAEAARRRSEVEVEEPYLGDAPAPEAPAPAPAPPPVMLPEEAIAEPNDESEFSPAPTETAEERAARLAAEEQERRALAEQAMALAAERREARLKAEAPSAAPAESAKARKARLASEEQERRELAEQAMALAAERKATRLAAEAAEAAKVASAEVATIEADDYVEVEPMGAEEKEEAAQLHGGPLANAPKPPMAETAQLLLRLQAMANASDVKRWMNGAGEEEVMMLIKGLKEVHASWLHADAALINMSMEMSGYKRREEEREVEKRISGEERRDLVGRVMEAEGKLQEADVRIDELSAALSEKQGEVDALTLSLQQAILDQKGVADKQLLKESKKGISSNRASLKTGAAAAMAQIPR